MNPPKPSKFGGQDDLKKFDDWVSHLLKYYRTFKITRPDQDQDRVLYTGLFLDGIATEWYGQEIESPKCRVFLWSFEDLICGLFKCFVHKVSARNAADQYNRTRYDSEKGALAFYNDLRPQAYRMVQPPDNYSFKRKYICGLPHSLVKSILEAHRISTKHSTIEEILEEVQQMETAQKAISLLTRHSNNPGGSPPRQNPRRNINHRSRGTRKEPRG